MKLYAISDLHVSDKSNYDALPTMGSYPEDWLIIGCDIGESEEHLKYALSILKQRFARLIWVPGNHDLWTLPADPTGLRGTRKYERLVEICRSNNVLTPEDPYAVWESGGQK